MILEITSYENTLYRTLKVVKHEGYPTDYSRDG